MRRAIGWSRVLVPAAVLAIVLLAPSGASADLFKILAYGDSVTFGSFDNANLGGYPGRLETLLGCTPTTCDVFNSGVGGERTPAGLNRLDGVLAASGPFQVGIFMEGTNDIFRNPPYSTTSIRTNLRNMGSKAEVHGASAVQASIIWFHPDGTRGSTRNDEVQDLRNAVLAMAATEQRTYVDVWNLLCPNGNDIHGHTQNQCFRQQHYFQGVPNPDPVGHPRASGYTMLADLFHDTLNAVPAPGVPTLVYPLGTIQELDPDYTWNRESPVRSTWYQIQVTGPSGTILDDWYESRFQCTSTDCTVPWFGNLPLGAYSWRVRGRNLRGYGTWTAWTPFVIDDSEIFVDGFESGDVSAWSESVP